MAIHRIRAWEEYKRLALTFKPSVIYYSRDPHPLRKPPWGLKLIFYKDFDGYVFIDYADGEVLHKTKIPIRGKNDREIPLLLKDIEHFLNFHVGNIEVSPIWFPG